MKINPPMVNAYYMTKPTSRNIPINQAGSFMEAFSAKVDTIEISRKGNEQSMVSGISKAIVGDLKDMDSQSRISELQDAVSSGSYSVPIEELARAMMQRVAI